mgnify:CR=1 FL=1
MLYISKDVYAQHVGSREARCVPTARSLCGCKSARSSEIVVNDAVASYFAGAVCPTRGDSAAVPVTSFSAAALKSFDLLPASCHSQMRMLSVSVCAGGGRGGGGGGGGLGRPQRKPRWRPAAAAVPRQRLLSFLACFFLLSCFQRFCSCVLLRKRTRRCSGQAERRQHASLQHASVPACRP